MNIEIANRLVNLRKENSLSQEALAEKLGISRQAVSKWERAEASPDTDNLILLARLYGVSLDQLLQTEEEIPVYEELKTVEEDTAEESKEEESETKEEGQGASGKKRESVHIDRHGIHVQSEDEEVHVGWSGIHVDSKKEKVHIDKNGVFVDGQQYYDGDWKRVIKPEFPFMALTFVIYIICGLLWQTWGIGLLIFCAVPLIHSLISAVKNRNMNYFAYPVLVSVVYVMMGYYKQLWHPGWVLFLTIPLYYSMVNYIQWMVRKK